MVKNIHQTLISSSSSSSCLKSHFKKTMTTSTPPQNSPPKPQQPQSQSQTQKKQVRRRLHTSRPYQERLLNMAEARREIVTALKQHRASMKQAAAATATQQRQKQHQIPNFTPNFPLNLPQEHSLPFSWNLPHLNFILPNQPLGLNLNFQDFNDIIQTSSPSSSSPSPPTLLTTSESQNLPNLGLRHVAEEEEEEMMRIRSMEEEASSGNNNLWVEEDDVFPTMSDVIEFPSWLNPTEELLQPYNQNLTHYSSLPQDPALSCLEIGEIEGEEDWFA